MIRRPPRSTLFPYPPLSRSVSLPHPVAREAAAPAAAVLAGQGDAYPALFAQLPAQFGAVAAPGARTHMGRQAAYGLGEEGAHLGAQGFVLGGDAGQGKGIKHAHCRAPWLDPTLGSRSVAVQY